MTYKYIAKAEIGNPLHKKLEVTAPNYKALVAEMYRAIEEIRYYTKGVNSYEMADEPYREAYTEDLIWPEIKWEITRDIC